jgi:hypothetical protein
MRIAEYLDMDNISFLQFDWLNFDIDLPSFQEFLLSSISDSDGIVTIDNGFKVVVKRMWTDTDFDLIETYLASLTEQGELAKKNPPLKVVSEIVQNARLFGDSLVVTFSAENILMGITQAGKTKVVSDYLADLSRYIQTGSLYEAVNEIDRLVSLGIPESLSPFITLERMDIFKNKIVSYLQG